MCCCLRIMMLLGGAEKTSPTRSVIIAIGGMIRMLPRGWS